MKRDMSRPAKHASRRGVLAGMASMAALPLVGCQVGDAVEDSVQSTKAALGARRGAAERFVRELVEGYNAKDIRRILRLLARDAMWTVNGELELDGRGAIGDFLVDYGAEQDAGSVANGRMINEASFLGEDAVLFNGRMINEASFLGEDAVLFEGRILAGVHGELAGFPAIERSAQIAYAFLCFLDKRGRCTAAQVLLDWAALSPDF